MDENRSNLPMETQGGVFDRIRRQNQRGEYWSSRSLAETLGYTDYRNFEQVIVKAKQACFKSGKNVEDHFGEYNEMIELGKGGKREVRSVMLSRYACYLVIQNADPGKEIVAIGQTYFATQTRRQEIADQEQENQLRIRLRGELATHNKRLAGTAKAAGVVTGLDYAIFQNHGYEGLYGGLNAQDIQQRKGLEKGKNILDHMGSTELAANFFRVTQAEEKLRREGVVGKGKVFIYLTYVFGIMVP